MLKNIGNKNGVLLNIRIGFYIAMSLAFGIGFAYFIALEKVFSSVILLFSYLVFLAFLIFFGFNRGETRYRHVILLIFGLSFLIGAVCFTVSVNSYKKSDLNNHYTTVIGSVKQVETTDNGCTIVLNRARATLKDEKLKYNVIVYVSGRSDLELGDKITFSEYLYDKAYIFDGKISAYDISDRIKWNAYVDGEGIEILEHSPNLFQKINIFIKNTLKKGLDDQSFSVAFALLTGDSNLIEEETITDFRQAGIAHVFAVSGLHIGFLAVAISFILSKLKTNKKVNICILIACLFIYSGVCGFSASSIRASVMCSIASILRIFGKRYDGLNALGIAGFLILLFSPLQMFCAGFVLSFGVVIGILVLQNTLERLFSFLPRKLASSIALVISAQLSGIPISIAFFGNFSSIAVLANLIFVPVVGFIFYVLLVSVLVGGIFSIPTVALFISGLLIKLVTFIITIFDYKIFMISGVLLGGFAVFYYLALFIIGGMFNLKRLTKTIVSLFLMTVCVLGSHVYTKTQEKVITIYVTSTNTFSATLILGEENTLVISWAKSNFSHYSLNRLTNRLGIEEIEHVIVSQGADNIPLQNLVTSLNYHFITKRVYYYGEIQQTTEKIITESFPYVCVENYYDGRLYVGNTFLDIKMQGRAFNYQSEKKNVLIFAGFGGVLPQIDFSCDNVDILIARDLCADLENRFSPRQAICYLACSSHQNAINNGNIPYKLGKTR